VIRADLEAELWQPLRAHPVLIVGFTERTGLATARLLEAHGVPYRISDLRPREALAPLLAGLRVAPGDVRCGPQAIDQLDGTGRILLSPGVPRAIPLVTEAEARGIPVWGDLDLLYPALRRARVVAITGTDGKTTTTTLMGRILERGGRTVVAGNVGVPVAAVYEEILAADHVVLEVSSFMAERLDRFRPDLAAVLNLAEDHVDRYPSMDAYAAAKLNLVANCTADDVVVLNRDDPRLAGFRPARARARYVSPGDGGFREGAFHLGGLGLAYRDCRIAGAHHVDNVLACLALADELGVPPREALEAVRTFPGVRHRYERVGTLGGVAVINDSKATTMHAVEAAVRSSGPSVALILGGRAKDLDPRGLRALADRLRRVVCYGEAGPRLRDQLDLPQCEMLYPFDDAVRAAWAACRPGDTLLLSPGCTSWDQFETYAQRGDRFTTLVRELAGGRA
jgi:UDP-N-acetylmuramoylalanine--D-glutamate ligase